MELTYLDSTKGKGSKHSDITEVAFVEFVPPQRAVQWVVFESHDPSFAVAMSMTRSLGERTGGTSVEIDADDVPPEVSSQNHVHGLAASLGNLANYLSGQRPGS